VAPNLYGLRSVCCANVKTNASQIGMGHAYRTREPRRPGGLLRAGLVPPSARFDSCLACRAALAPLIAMITPPSFPTPPPQELYTLDPLMTRGADALAPDSALGIKAVFLQELGIGYENVFQEMIVWRASDVLACLARSGPWPGTLPPGARPACAVLQFHLTGAGRPYFAEIWPPHILTLTPANAADPIIRWLALRGFIRTPTDGNGAEA
jgi:hypothetical protein